MKLTKEQVQKKTLELLNSDDQKLVEYITDKFVDSDCEESEEDNIPGNVIYGHDMAYWIKDGEEGYCYKRGAGRVDDIRNACGSLAKFLPWSKGWNHEVTDKLCPPGGDRAIVKFVKT